MGVEQLHVTSMKLKEYSRYGMGGVQQLCLTPSRMGGVQHLHVTPMELAEFGPWILTYMADAAVKRLKYTLLNTIQSKYSR